MTQASSSAKNELSLYSLGNWEVFFWINTVQVGIGILSLPRVIAEEAGHSAWMVLPVAGLLVHLAMWMMIVLLRRFEPFDIYDIFQLLFGPWVGNLLSGLFALYCLTACGLVARSYIELVQTWLFPTTSTIMFYLLLLLPIYYVSVNPRLLARFGIATFFGTIWMTFLLVTPLKEVQEDFYLPLFDTTWLKMFKALLSASHSVTGFEVLLMFYPFIQNKKKALKMASAGNWLTIFVYLYITLISFGFYSQGQLQVTLLPTVYMLQIVQLPIIERIEHIGIALWSFLVVSTASSYLWCSGRYLLRFKWFQKYKLPWLMPPLMILGYWPEELYDLQQFALTLGYVGGGLCLFLPPFLLVVAMIRGKKGVPDQATEEGREAS